MGRTLEQVVVIATAIVGLATLAVVVSRNSNTAGVIKAASGGFADALRAAVSPVTGGGGMNFAPPTNIGW